MRIKFLPLMVAVAAAVLALTIVTAGQASKGDIFGSDHDTGTPGNPTCAQCHIPHKSNAMYLWAQDLYSGPDAYAGESNVVPLCFSCHDGSVASDGAYFVNADHNHPQGTVQYDPDHVPGTGDEYPITEHAMYETSCKKCMEPDCVKCHDVHSNTWVFLDPDRFEALDTDGDEVPDTDFLNASVCAWCHSGSRHGIRNYEGGEPVEHTTHPEMITEPEGAADFVPPVGADRTWNGDAAMDLSGTRLWSDDTVYYNSPGDDTAQFVEFSGAGDIRCMTCHTPHAAQNEQLTAMATSEETSSHAPVCENCHE